MGLVDGAGYVSPAPEFARDVHIERHGYADRGQPQSHEGMRENAVWAPALPAPAAPLADASLMTISARALLAAPT